MHVVVLVIIIPVSQFPHLKSCLLGSITQQPTISLLLGSKAKTMLACIETKMYSIYRKMTINICLDTSLNCYIKNHPRSYNDLSYKGISVYYYLIIKITIKVYTYLMFS